MGTGHFRKAVLKGKVRFDLLFQEGRWAGGPSAKLIYLKRSPGEASHIAVCIPRSFRKAVQRNHLKRVLRAALDETIPRIKPGYWIAVFPKIDFEQLDHGERIRTLRALLNRSGLIEDGSGGG